MFREVKASSNVSNHINRNIGQDKNNNDADIEILNINSPEYSTGDLVRHDSSLNEAWRFINTTRRQNFTTNEGKEINSRDYSEGRPHRHETMYENAELNYIPKPYVKSNTFWEKPEKNKRHARNLRFSTINDYLDSLDNSSDEETANIVEQSYFQIEDPPQAVEIFDGTIYAVANEKPMFIYSYKNKNYTPHPNEVLINSSNQESQSNSTSSISVENANEESLSYEKSYYRISTSFRPVIIPRLPLTSYMLPTVTEIKESPKVKEISFEDNAVRQKPSNNSWVISDNDSCNSDDDNTTETNIESSADDLSPDNSKRSLHSCNNSVLNQNELKENTTDGDTRKVFLSASKATFSSKSTGYSKRNKAKLRNNNYLDLNETEQVNLKCKKTGEDDSSEANEKDTSSYPTELLSAHSSIPTLHLSLNTDIETSWFKKCMKCISCCK